MIAIIGSCGANISSIQFAIQRLGKSSCVTTDATVIQSASHVILPGVGTAKHAMAQLQKHQLLEVIRLLTKPVLGICLGMQLMYEFSEEGNVNCLNLFPGQVCHLQKIADLTLPHMGWNQLNLHTNTSSLMTEIPHKSYVYFVHSYAAPVNDKTIAVTQHGEHFSSIAQNNNFYGMQFHPERSGKVGEKLLQNFLELT